MNEEHEAVEKAAASELEHDGSTGSNLSRRQFARYTTAMGIAAALGTNIGGKRTVNAGITDYPFNLTISDKCKVTLVVCGRVSIGSILQDRIIDHIETYISNANYGAGRAVDYPAVAGDCEVVARELTYLKALLIFDNRNLRFHQLFQQSKEAWDPALKKSMERLSDKMTLPFYAISDTSRPGAHGVIMSSKFQAHLNRSSLRDLFTTPTAPIVNAPADSRLDLIRRSKNVGVLQERNGGTLVPIGQSDECWSINAGECVYDSGKYCEEIDGQPSEISDVCP